MRNRSRLALSSSHQWRSSIVTTMGCSAATEERTWAAPSNTRQAWRGQRTAERLDHGGERNYRRGVVAAPPEGDRPLGHRVAHEFVGQPGLSYPRLPLQQDDPP